MRIGVTKEEFVHSLGETLSLTRERVKGCSLKDEDTVLIHYNQENGYTREVNIARCSALAIMKEVAAKV